MIDALARRAPAIVVATLIACLLCAWLGAPRWISGSLAAGVAGLALALFAARGGRRARHGSADERNWLQWEIAGKGTPPGSYLLAFFSFLTIVLTGLQSPRALPAWAALALAAAWAMANREYPAEEDADL